MDTDIQTQKHMSHEIRLRFDNTLGKHLERLLGTRYGIGGMALDLATISCLTLLSEREKEIESFSESFSDRYTREALLNELAEIGFDPDEYLKEALQEMVEKGYIEIDDDVILTPKKYATSMAALLDLVFPKMPGMNLIAYFVQTMDEVQSGRKELDIAISQFDQILQMQGVFIKKENKDYNKEKESGGPKGSQYGSRVGGPYSIPSGYGNIFSYRDSEWRKAEAGVIESASPKKDMPKETLSESDQKLETRKFDIKQDLKEKALEKIETENLSSGPEVCRESFEEIISESGLQTESAGMEMTGPGLSTENIVSIRGKAEDIEMSGEKGADLSIASDLEDVLNRSLDISQTVLTKDAVIEPRKDFQCDILKDDTTVEKKIIVFQEELALQCPICKNEKVRSEETVTGKKYYRCSRKDCNFISWGKPHHIFCPICRNPFLVEASDKYGKMILKCPRATCRYWQEPLIEINNNFQEDSVCHGREEAKPEITSKKPRKRFVRRVLVRRKK